MKWKKILDKLIIFSLILITSNKRKMNILLKEPKLKKRLTKWGRRNWCFNIFYRKCNRNYRKKDKKLKKRKNNKAQRYRVTNLKLWISKDKKCNQFKSRRDSTLSIRMFSINSLRIIENNKSNDLLNHHQNYPKINQKNQKHIEARCLP